MYKIFDLVIKFISEVMKSLKVKLIVRGKFLANIKIQRGIFQGDAFSPLLFAIAMMSMNHILRKCTWKLQERINHLIYIDDLKLFGKKTKKNWRHWFKNNNVQSRYRNGICHWKCAMSKLKSRKRKIMEWIELPDQEKNQNTLRKGNLRVLVNTGGEHYRKCGDERKKKEYLRRTRKLLETELCKRSLFKWIDTLTGSLVRYSKFFSRPPQVDERRTSTNGPEDTKTNDDA